MTTDLTGRLRADMARFTRDVRVPPGLALKAYRHGRRRRIRFRVAIAAGTTAVLAASAVTAAGVTGVFVSTATRPIQTIAYIIKKVESALAPANADSLMEYTYVTLSPSGSFEPSPKVTLVVSWQYGGTQHESDYGQDGQHVFDVRLISGKSGTYTVVDYSDRTWYTGSFRRFPLLPGWPSPQFTSIREYLEDFTSESRQVVDGIDAIKLTTGPIEQTTGGQTVITLWVNPVTFRPIRYDAPGIQEDLQWLPATPARLALLDQPVPAGFQHVPSRRLLLTRVGWQP
jgi:hypothetical protein